MDVVIAGACRTPIGKLNGSLKNVSAPKLGAVCIKEVLQRTGIAPKDVDEVVMGNVISAGLGQNPARQASIYAGISHEVPAVTVNKVCGSGMKSIMMAVQAIRCGDAEIVVAGGTENMSAAPYLLEKAREGYRLGNGVLVDVMIKDGLWDVYYNMHMGKCAELLGEKYKISRKEQDEFALQSNKRAITAMGDGLFKKEIVPLTELAMDECPRMDTSIEALSKLKPVFKDDGTITAGNASKISDGASALVLMSDKTAKKLSLDPLARIRGYAVNGVDPKFFGIAPVDAVKKVFKKTGTGMKDVGLIELNEAFAVQALAVIKELSLDQNITNVNGGALALGHPIGCSGARIVTTLIHAMKKRNVELGLAAICIGGGLGLAMMLER